MSDVEEAEDRNNFQVFVKGDRNKKPVRFFLHGSLTIGQQESLERDVTSNGGIICNDERESDVILVHLEDLDAVTDRYAHSKTIYVELPEFVEKCLRRKQYFHDKPVKKALGGRPLGGIRREFTMTDDFHLAEYLANMIPDPHAGGRTGNGVYKQLCEKKREGDFPWAKRHTWQSWRTRYRSNQQRFVQMIEDYLVYNPRHPDGKGEYRHDQRAAGQGKRSAVRHQGILKRRRQRVEETEEPDEDRQSESETGRDSDEYVPRAPKRRGPRIRKARRQMTVELEVSSSSDDRKRRTNSAAATTSPSTPKQSLREVQHDSAKKDSEVVSEGSWNLLDDGQLLQFDNESFSELADVPLAHKSRPSDTQTTLVATKSVPPAPVKTNSGGETPKPSLTPIKRRKAARNRARSASAKAGATGLTNLPSSPIKDTQMTVVGTQKDVPPTSQQQIYQKREPANGDAPQLQSGATDAPYRNVRLHAHSVEPKTRPREAAPNRGRGNDDMRMREREDQNERFDSNSNISDAEVNEEDQSIDLVEKALGYVKVDKNAESKHDRAGGYQMGDDGNEEEPELGHNQTNVSRATRRQVQLERRHR